MLINNLLLEERKLKEVSLYPLEHQFIIIRERSVTKRIAFNDIIMVKSDSNYSIIFHRDGKEILTSKTLKYWALILEGNDFIRVHASYLINRNHILEIQNNKRNILMNNNLNAAISRQMNMRKLINEMNFIFNKKSLNVLKYIILIFLGFISQFGFSQAVGIGTSTPDSKLNIAGGSEASLSDGTGYFLIGLKENQNIVFDNNELQARNNGIADDLFLNPHGGNVAIGTTSANVKLKIDGGTDASLSGGGYLQIGPTNGENIIIDNNEIMARNNEATDILYLQNNGGKTYIGNDLEIAGNISGNINIEQTTTEITEEYQLINVTNCSWKNIYNDGSLVDPNEAYNFTLNNGTNGQTLIITTTGSGDYVILNESANVNLPSAWITIGQGDILQLIYFSAKWHMISFTQN